MSLLTVQNLKFGFADGVLFQDAAFAVEENDRIGLIGVNGSGKTSLFKLITGEYTPNEGGIVRGKNVRIGFMEQYLSCDENVSLYDEALTAFSDVIETERQLDEITKKLLTVTDNALIERQAYLTEELERRDGLTFRAKTRSALLGLGFSENELSLEVRALSGGQRSKLSLCKLLLGNSNLLLLDEPTNNLDIEAVTWLEDYLSKYKGALITVSHDRYFLDKVTSSTIEISHNKILFTVGNYTEYYKLKAEHELYITREYEKNTAEIKRIEGIIEQQRRFNRERNFITIQSKQKQIDKIKESLVLPEKMNLSVNFSFNSDIRSGDDVLTVKALKKSFPGKPLFSDFDLSVRRNERVFILGPNGCGKSTFLKIINRELNADEGVIRLGTNVKIGYFDQNIDKLHSEKTVLDEVWDLYRFLTETEIRSALALFLFRGEDVYKKVELLSGGERAKISLLKIMLSKPNFLILDEPTNHLDISSREVLEKALSEFDGTILTVSHDRYFINKLSTNIVYLTHTGAVAIDGNYESYIEYRNGEALSSQTEKNGSLKKPNDYKLQKERESNERKRISRIARLEQEISAAENEILSLEAEISSPETASDYEALLNATNRLQSAKDKLDSLYIEWEKLQSE